MLFYVYVVQNDRHVEHATDRYGNPVYYANRELAQCEACALSHNRKVRTAVSSIGDLSFIPEKEPTYEIR